jgi:hypothetical protein
VWKGEGGDKWAGRGEEAYGEPDGNVGIGWGASAAKVLLIAEGLDHDWVLKGTYAHV